MNICTISSKEILCAELSRLRSKTILRQMEWMDKFLLHKEPVT